MDNSKFLDDFEQDLVLACKGRYGKKGIEKVIAENVYLGDIKDVCLSSKYYWIKELFFKLADKSYLSTKILINELSFDRIHSLSYYEQLDNINNVSLQILNMMRSMISGLKVKECDRNGKSFDLISLHEPNKDFMKEENS